MILYTHVNKITTIKAHLTEDIPSQMCFWINNSSF